MEYLCTVCCILSASKYNDYVKYCFQLNYVWVIIDLSWFIIRFVLLSRPAAQKDLKLNYNSLLADGERVMIVGDYREIYGEIFISTLYGSFNIKIDKIGLLKFGSIIMIFL